MHQFLRFETARTTNVQNSTDAEHHSRCPNIRSWYRQQQDRRIFVCDIRLKNSTEQDTVSKALEYSTTRLIKQLQ